MQPQRPFRGSPYDKDMFTFLPMPSDRDVLTESSRKRKLISSDNQIARPAPSFRYGFTMSDPKCNTGDWSSKVLRNSVPAFPPGESLHSGVYSHKSRNWEQHNYVASHDFDRRDPHETRSKYTGSSFSGKLHPPNHKDSLPLVHLSEVETHRTPKWASSVAEDLNHCEDHESSAQVTRERNLADVHEFRKFPPHKPVQMKAIASVSHEQASREPKCLQQPLLYSGALVVGSDGKGGQTQNTSTWSLITEDFNPLESHQSNAHIARGENASHFREFQNVGLEKPAQMNVVASRSHEQASKNLQDSHFIKPGVSFQDADRKSCPEETYNVESSSNVNRGVNAITSAGCDSTRFGDNVGSSLYSLQCETNDLLQNTLRLLSASGIDLAGSYDCKIQSNGDEVKTMKSLPDSVSQNVNHSEKETTLSKDEACPNLDKCSPNGEKDSVKLDQEHKSVNGASTPMDKLWDGTLQLSASVTVSAVAFFKSGEKMQDLSWSGSVEVKGKVRLEAFEKYVQDLPRSRNRGLMVMSLRLKEGSSDSGYKGIKEVARKYKDGKKVGFAQLSSGVDMYICPNSDTIITILAKYGFFKGMTAALDKSDPLLGCVVWRKHTPSVTTTKTAKANGLSSPSKTLPSPTPVVGENSTVPMKNQEPITSSSNKDQQLTKTGEKTRDMSPIIAQNNLVPISGTNTQLSESKTDKEVDKPTPDKEVDKPTPPLLSVGPKQSALTSDDDDLPEYDFRVAISQTSANKPFDGRTVDTRLDAEQFNSSHISRPIPAQLGTESSAVPGPPPSFHFQGQLPQNIRHQSESHIHKLPTDPRKKIPEQTANIGHQPELQIPSLPLPQQKRIGDSVPSSKPRNLFDDDDMPEWCPPDFTKSMQELAPRPGQPLPPSHSNAIPVSGFKDSAPGHLPARLPAPALAPPKSQDKDYSFPHHSTALVNQPATTGFTNKGASPPPGFGSYPAFRPRFNPPGRKKPIHPSSWRGLRS